MNDSEIICGNHTLKEFYVSETAMRKGIINTPSTATVARIRVAARAILVPIEEEFGPMRINSWYRSPALCISIGSNASSNHTFGDTGDIEPVDKSVRLLDVIRFINDRVPYRELIAEYFPDGWIHVCSRPGLNDGIMKLKDNLHNYSRTTIDELERLYR